MWGGRFAETSCNQSMNKFNSSFHVDQRLFKEDLQGSKAYAQCQYKTGMISIDVHQSIQKGLQKIDEEWKKGVFPLDADDEDIHTAHERRLKELIGSSAGGHLHTGRSRNEQVVTDMLLWMKGVVKHLIHKLTHLMRICVQKSKTHIWVIMPGYTHMQKAQPIRFSHLLLSYAAMYERDLRRLRYVQSSIDECPLGSGALAGNAFNMNREGMADELDFSRVSINSIETVGNRDFVADFMYWGSMLAIHCSRVSEDLLIFSTKEFSYIKLSEQFSTGSSLMPQKKNPDSLELVRGKCGQIMGKCFGFMTTMKGLPSAYNKDMQEDKKSMFDVYDTICDVINIIGGVIDTMEVDHVSCAKALTPEMLATDLAYYLTKKGISFREAHTIVGQLVLKAEKLSCELTKMSLDDLQTISPYFSGDVSDVWSYERSVEQYQSTGGTSQAAVTKQIDYFEKLFNSIEPVCDSSTITL